jgi:transcriptional regulator with AAA-type ATPase domain
MPWLSDAESRTARAIAAIGFTNPFLPERIALEREALGEQFSEFVPFLHYQPDGTLPQMFPNFERLTRRADELVERLRDALSRGEAVAADELRLYEDLVLYVLYCRYLDRFDGLIQSDRRDDGPPAKVEFYDAFVGEFERLLRLPGCRLPSDLEPAVLFAGLFQFARAFCHIFRAIVGGSLPAARMRAAVWESIFTHDMRRYIAVLYRVMGEIPTLITGPSGTGKELVAQAIARSRYIAFDAGKRQFACDYRRCFHGLNLSALTPTLIESELFGHVRGAFNDARDRDGFLDPKICQVWDSVFLDEIGELDPQVQVKLLRVLQTREFHKVGDARTVRRFEGKILAATNRDLVAELRAGRFREDFYYRLCADQIRTVSLREQLADTPDDLANFTRLIASRLLPGLEEASERLAEQVESWIKQHLGHDYAWPGNIRELEQCVRSVMIHGNYLPAGTGEQTSASHAAQQDVVDRLLAGQLSRDELLRQYCSLALARHGSYSAAAKWLNVDWRTLKALVVPELAELWGCAATEFPWPDP